MSQAARRARAPQFQTIWTAPQGVPDQAPILAAEPLTEREREVLRHVSGLLSAAEVASEMHISANTVKTHLTHIYRKLATTHRGDSPSGKAPASGSPRKGRSLTRRPAIDWRLH